MSDIFSNSGQNKKDGNLELESVIHFIEKFIPSEIENLEENQQICYDKITEKYSNLSDKDKKQEIRKDVYFINLKKIKLINSGLNKQIERLDFILSLINKYKRNGKNKTYGEIHRDTTNKSFETKVKMSNEKLTEQDRLQIRYEESIQEFVTVYAMNYETEKKQKICYKKIKTRYWEQPRKIKSDKKKLKTLQGELKKFKLTDQSENIKFILSMIDQYEKDLQEKEKVRNKFQSKFNIIFSIHNRNQKKVNKLTLEQNLQDYQDLFNNFEESFFDRKDKNGKKNIFYISKYDYAGLAKKVSDRVYEKSLNQEYFNKKIESYTNYIIETLFVNDNQLLKQDFLNFSDSGKKPFIDLINHLKVGIIELFDSQDNEIVKKRLDELKFDFYDKESSELACFMSGNKPVIKINRLTYSNCQNIFTIINTLSHELTHAMQDAMINNILEEHPQYQFIQSNQKLDKMDKEISAITSFLMEDKIVKYTFYLSNLKEQQAFHVGKKVEDLLKNSKDIPNKDRYTLKALKQASDNNQTTKDNVIKKYKHDYKYKHK